jgi:hypothetical protein
MTDPTTWARLFIFAQEDEGVIEFGVAIPV